jgi:NapC/NirT cytochrome c family protein
VRLSLPAAVRNPISLVGITIATAAAWLFIALLGLELLGYFTNPYVGLLTFVTVPLAFIAGLVLIPAGVWLSARRRRTGTPDLEWPVIDLGQPRQRVWLFGVVALTLVNILIVSAAGFGTVHYMERTEFCGQVCHTTMEPEFVAHQAWPHSQVSCVSCHVGAGAGSFIEAKLAGTRQLFHLATNQVPRPVPTPVRALGRTEDTCGGCHRNGHLGDRQKLIREYANDESNTETATALMMHVGSAIDRPGAGIHRHIALDIEYVATSESRETIPFVRVHGADGTREFIAGGVTEAQIAGGVRRRMDCTDCHNRPAHTMSFTPERAVDAAMAEGRVPRALPFVRREAVAAVAGDYANRDAALAAIAKRLNDFYGARPGTDAALIRQAVASTQDVWSRNVFPAMRVRFGTYANHLGHVDTPGCFRCHDDSHKSRDGRVIAQECELCHEIK